jgi:hypothetical protein
MQIINEVDTKDLLTKIKTLEGKENTMIIKEDNNIIKKIKMSNYKKIKAVLKNLNILTKINNLMMIKNMITMKNVIMNILTKNGVVTEDLMEDNNIKNNTIMM